MSSVIHSIASVSQNVCFSLMARKIPKEPTMVAVAAVSSAAAFYLFQPQTTLT